MNKCLRLFYRFLFIFKKKYSKFLLFLQKAFLLFTLKTLPSFTRRFKHERAVSPSVRALINQYQYSKEKLKDKSNLHTVQDNNDEVDLVTQLNDDVDVNRENEEEEEVEVEAEDSKEPSIESNTIKKTFSDYDHESNVEEEAQNDRGSVVSADKQSFLNENYQKYEEEVEFYKLSRPQSAPQVSGLTGTPRCYYYKPNSDIYPVFRKNLINNQKLDASLNLEQMKMCTNRMRPLDPLVPVDSDSFGQENLQDDMNAKLVKTGIGSVQVNEYELKKNERDLMSNRVDARRLDFCESLVETLVNAAQIAGSSENITVNCVLLPGCNL
jgi:hypothetical protein